MNQSSSQVLNEEIDGDGDGDGDNDNGDGGNIHDYDDDGVCAFENDPSPTVERIVESELGQSGFRGPSLLSRNSQQIANSKREILTSRGNPQNNKLTAPHYENFLRLHSLRGTDHRRQLIIPHDTIGNAGKIQYFLF